ncbi:acyltransferase [Winogradskyella sediminis]|uniref:Maltose O-acetyltransferase n=1 Tax=Winogradskyella sediminis TaxID=1382466 RepID=A0A1H1PU52_9FLAO|nr:DapH/DapD/GlmU-related protein [Winogradskyella sediminis]SDS14700.1 maltose O-acetyltransferase [Winogradskyella sediminis]
MSSLKLYIIRLFVLFIPETRGFSIKRFLYRWAGAKIGENVRICSSAIILGSGKLKIGSNTWVGQNVMLLASKEIEIGKNVDIGPKVYIGNGTHVIEPNSERIAGKGKSIKIIIGNGTWLGVNSTILPGVVVGDKVVVGAGSLVNTKLESYTVAVGSPAKAIKIWDVKTQNWIPCKR